MTMISKDLAEYTQSSSGDSSIDPQRIESEAPLARSELQPRRAGSAQDKILWISHDFDAPLEEFRDYME